jgi:hypothetical protein
LFHGGRRLRGFAKNTTARATVRRCGAAALVFDAAGIAANRTGAPGFDPQARLLERNDAEFRV